MKLITGSRQLVRLQTFTQFIEAGHKPDAGAPVAFKHKVVQHGTLCQLPADVADNRDAEIVRHELLPHLTRDARFRLKEVFA